jgi:hypothetical protein
MKTTPKRSPKTTPAMVAADRMDNLCYDRGSAVEAVFNVSRSLLGLSLLMEDAGEADRMLGANIRILSDTLAEAYGNLMFLEQAKDAMLAQINAGPAAADQKGRAA